MFEGRHGLGCELTWWLLRAPAEWLEVVKAPPSLSAERVLEQAIRGRRRPEVIGERHNVWQVRKEGGR